MASNMFLFDPHTVDTIVVARNIKAFYNSQNDTGAKEHNSHQGSVEPASPRV